MSMIIAVSWQRSYVRPYLAGSVIKVGLHVWSWVVRQVGLCRRQRIRCPCCQPVMLDLPCIVPEEG